jgi:hypothetical protein
MLGEYTCLQQMKVVNATNDNQCVNPAGEESRGGIVITAALFLMHSTHELKHEMIYPDRLGTNARK